MTPNPPKRLTESTFRRWEGNLAVIAKDYPKVVRFDPAQRDMSPDNFANWLRDASTSLAKYKWPTEHASLQAWPTIQPTLIFSASHEWDGMVAVGTKKALRELLAAKDKPPVQVVIDSVDPHDLGDIDYEKFMILCQLAHERLLTKPVLFSIAPDDVTHWLAKAYRYDVEIEERDGRYLLT